MDQYLSNNINNINNNTNKIIYNEEQLEFINSPLENSKLLGIPGGGKTQSIIGKVLRHSKDKEITLNNQFLIMFLYIDSIFLYFHVTLTIFLIILI